MLFILALLVGVTMYSLLFYAPLLLQGGFGLSPQDAGLLITPMVVFITVGSIINGRIITRIRNPNRMLYAGFILMALSCLGIVTTHNYTAHGLIAAYMLMAGLGMGFIMPNLTVFAQQTAGRSHLGIATALLQSLRMIGGMLGTAVVGTMVNHSYFSGVESTLRGASARWLPQLDDPQMLVNPEAQTQFLAQLAHQGQDGTSLIEIARVALVGAIHEGNSSPWRSRCWRCGACGASPGAIGAPRQNGARRRRRVALPKQQQGLQVIQHMGQTYRVMQSAFSGMVGHALPRWRILLALHECGQCSQKHGRTLPPRPRFAHPPIAGDAEARLDRARRRSRRQPPDQRPPHAGRPCRGRRSPAQAGGIFDESLKGLSASDIDTLNRVLNVLEANFRRAAGGNKGE